MRELLLEIQNVSHNYVDDSTVHAIKDINLDIFKGEFIAVLGPSGCGKSTLLNILAGFLRPTKGKVCMHNEPITGPDKNRGVMFQSNSLYPWLSVEDNIAFGLRMQGYIEKEQKSIAHSLLQEVQLLDFAKAKTFELSGGMKQRVALARVLANKPEVILMDEPLGALDAITRHKMQALIRRLWAEHKNTVFLITHDIDEALSLATKIIVMSESPGRIEKIFDVEYTYQALENPKQRIKIDSKYLEIKEEILDAIESSEK